MQNDIFTNKYNIIQVQYFDGNNLPTKLEYQQILNNCGAQWPNRKMRGFFCHPNDIHNLKVRSMPISGGSMPKEYPGDEPIIGGGQYTRKNAALSIVHSDFSIGIQSASHSFFGKLPPNFHLSISEEWSKEIPAHNLIRFMRDNIAILDIHKTYFGFIDVSSSLETCAGTAYTHTPLMNLPLNRHVDLCMFTNDYNSTVRRSWGVHWGNYYGDSILACLGGKREFVNKCTSILSCNDGTLSGMIWEFPNGVFVSLSNSPYDCEPGTPLHSGVLINMRRILMHLIKHNAIIGS